MTPALFYITFFLKDLLSYKCRYEVKKGKSPGTLERKQRNYGK